MYTFSKFFYTFIAVFLFFCIPNALAQDSTQVRVESPKIGVKIPLGEAITAGGEKITFVKVIEDSRCPRGTQCVWEGQVKIEVHFSEDEMTVDPKIATIKGVKPVQIMENAKYTFSVIAVHPYPEIRESIESRAYAIVLKVVEKE